MIPTLSVLQTLQERSTSCDVELQNIKKYGLPQTKMWREIPARHHVGQIVEDYANRVGQSLLMSSFRQG